MMDDILRSTGRAIVPAVTAMERGEEGDFFHIAFQAFWHFLQQAKLYL